MLDKTRQISDAEKQSVLSLQGLRCFIDGHPMDPGDVEFDHIKAHAEYGVSTTDNVAAVCRRHNRDKRTLSLAEYRDRLLLQKFFEGARKRRLHDPLLQR